MLVSGHGTTPKQSARGGRDSAGPVGAAAVAGEDPVVHIDEGFDFLGFRIQRHRKPGTTGPPSTPTRRRSFGAVTGKVKTLCRRMDTNQPLEVLLLTQLNRLLRGWCAHFRPGVSQAPPSPT